MIIIRIKLYSGKDSFRYSESEIIKIVNCCCVICAIKLASVKKLIIGTKVERKAVLWFDDRWDVADEF